MSLEYGYAKATIVSAPSLQSKRLRSETQYHEHVGLLVGGQHWDVAINVGTNDADDLLKYKLVYDFHHAGLIQKLSAAQAGWQSLTGQAVIPALDFMRSDVLAETGDWRNSDVLDGTELPEPVASLKRLLVSAQQMQYTVYLFGRMYAEGNGVHDIHMNQGSTGKIFEHRSGDDSNDHNDVWQDGALFVDLGQTQWAAYFAAFNQQLVPTDGLGNPLQDSQSIGSES